MTEPNTVKLQATELVKAVMAELGKAQVLDAMLDIGDSLEPVEGVPPLLLLYSTALAIVTGVPQKVIKAKGGFHYVMPLDPGKFETKTPSEVQHAGHSESHDHAEGFSARGPSDPEHDFGQQYDSFGG